ncbi:hypothetical protein ACOMCU_28020 [Lysinibacillus sp. UGB7]|uniref:hypothetical protein n=1 Tax=Lysinibacillus sp. UGB7 TaxID=3411039 RepID=UPI003B795C82
MPEIQTVEKMAIMFNSLQGKDLNLVSWDIEPHKGIVLARDKDGNTFKITIEPQQEVIT